jgi:hypothetical protein
MIKKDYLGKEAYSIYTQIDESDTESDQIWSDLTIRRNPIGIRVTESLKKFLDLFFAIKISKKTLIFYIEEKHSIFSINSKFLVIFLVRNV